MWLGALTVSIEAFWVLQHHRLRMKSLWQVIRSLTNNVFWHPTVEFSQILTGHWLPNPWILNELHPVKEASRSTSVTRLSNPFNSKTTPTGSWVLRSNVWPHWGDEEQCFCLHSGCGSLWFPGCSDSWPCSHHGLVGRVSGNSMLSWIPWYDTNRYDDGVIRVRSCWTWVAKYVEDVAHLGAEFLRNRAWQWWIHLAKDSSCHRLHLVSNHRSGHVSLLEIVSSAMYPRLHIGNGETLMFLLSLPSTPIGILSEVKVQIPRASPIPGRSSVWFRREKWANMVDGPRHERLEDILLQEELHTWHFGPWKCRGQAKPCETNAEDGLWHGYFLDGFMDINHGHVRYLSFWFFHLQLFRACDPLVVYQVPIANL